MDIVWTKHAEERQEQWNEKRGIPRNEIEDVIGDPGQVVSGHGDAEVAQKRRGPGLIQVPFVREGSERILLTVYWTSDVDKYWND
ncbi:hypothetical protein GGP84_002167 [Salinibacter ruber]|uniref:DUF4258 domain-containing protein n=1 Tax=Salinibacter ruber TaxID=146919 RepID=UPI002168ED03|nr:DUF4258 domain-containing protein [Salinibacter ruber]MCS3939535.1 hypothetical protein [Salinibacter ruber]